MRRSRYNSKEEGSEGIIDLDKIQCNLLDIIKIMMMRMILMMTMTKKRNLMRIINIVKRVKEEKSKEITITVIHPINMQMVEE